MGTLVSSTSALKKSRVLSIKIPAKHPSFYTDFLHQADLCDWWTVINGNPTIVNGKLKLASSRVESAMMFTRQDIEISFEFEHDAGTSTTRMASIWLDNSNRYQLYYTGSRQRLSAVVGGSETVLWDGPAESPPNTHNWIWRRTGGTWYFYRDENLIASSALFDPSHYYIRFGHDANIFYVNDLLIC